MPQTLRETDSPVPVPAVASGALPTGPIPVREPFHAMAKPIGARCNLACTYCYYLEKTALLHPTDSGVLRMSDATLEVFVRDYLAAQPAEGEIIFASQGGEPTLRGIDFFRGAVEHQKHYAPGALRVSRGLSEASICQRG